MGHEMRIKVFTRLNYSVIGIKGHLVDALFRAIRQRWFGIFCGAFVLYVCFSLNEYERISRDIVYKDTFVYPSTCIGYHTLKANLIIVKQPSKHFNRSKLQRFFVNKLKRAHLKCVVSTYNEKRASSILPGCSVGV